MTDTEAKNKFKLTEKLEKRFLQFQKITDKDKRFERIIELGKKLKDFDPADKTTENQVHGCASLVYITGKKIDNKMQFQGWSNSHLVKGLVALLIEGMNDNSTEAILAINPAFIEEMGIAQTLTASRANGFLNTYKKLIEITNKEK
jgi:cysteine desulfuration protein SufE